MRFIALFLVLAGWALLTPVALIALRFWRDDRFRNGLKAAAIIGLMPYIVAFYARFIEPKVLTVQRAEIVSAAWRADPIRIGVITDVHIGGPHVSAARVEKIVARLNAEKPDIVVLLGDYANGRLPAAERSAVERAEEQRGIAAFAKLSAPKGVYAAIGNNDLLYGEDVIRSALESAHAIVLQNAATPIPGLNAYVVGIDEFGRGRADIPKGMAKVPVDASAIAIMHYPDSFADMPARVALSLAGHTHCGQAGLPFAMKFVPPSNASAYWRCHYYEADGRSLYVSGGIGTSVLPMRLFAPPEVNVITLRGK